MGRYRRRKGGYRRPKQEDEEGKNEEDEEVDEEEEEEEEEPEVHEPSPKKRRGNSSSPSNIPVVNLVQPEPKISLAVAYNTRLRVKEDVEQIEKAHKKPSSSDPSSEVEVEADETLVARFQKRAVEIQAQLDAFKVDINKLKVVPRKKRQQHCKAQAEEDQANSLLTVATLRKMLKDEGKVALANELQEQPKDQLIATIVE